MDKEKFKELFREMLESGDIRIEPVTRSNGAKTIQVFIDEDFVYESDY